MTQPASDHGERYETTFVDSKGRTRIMGWSDEYPLLYLKVIETHPDWHTPMVLDRKPGSTTGGQSSTMLNDHPPPENGRM